MSRQTRRRNALFFTVIAIAALIAGTTLSGTLGRVSKKDTKGTDPRVVSVLNVIDGDTINVKYASGDTGHVRYIGIDTPEINRSGKTQCFANDATAMNRKLVENERVRLVVDKKRKDQYGRLLAYVYRQKDNLFVNSELVSQGYAQVLTVPPNIKHQNLFLSQQRKAQLGDRGLWQKCQSVS